MNSQGQLQPEHEIIPFIASFLRDITQIAADIKAYTYQLVNIEPPHTKRTLVHHNIYSIMEACHHGFEDLVRAESLLKGHLKGKISAERERDSVRESRRTARNEAALPELGGAV